MSDSIGIVPAMKIGSWHFTMRMEETTVEMADEKRAQIRR